MKYLLISLLIMVGYASKAQTPAPDPDTIKNPVKQIDPEVKQEPADPHYIKNEVRIDADELPAVVLKDLKQHEPTAWKKSVVYRSKLDNSYRIEIRDGGNARFYHYNKEGKQLQTKHHEEKKKQP